MGDELPRIQPALSQSQQSAVPEMDEEQANAALLAASQMAQALDAEDAAKGITYERYEEPDTPQAAPAPLQQEHDASTIRIIHPDQSSPGGNPHSPQPPTAT